MAGGHVSLPSSPTNSAAEEQFDDSVNGPLSLINGRYPCIVFRYINTNTPTYFTAGHGQQVVGGTQS